MVFPTTQFPPTIPYCTDGMVENCAIWFAFHANLNTSAIHRRCAGGPLEQIGGSPNVNCHLHWAGDYVVVRSAAYGNRVKCIYIQWTERCNPAKSKETRYYSTDSSSCSSQWKYLVKVERFIPAEGKAELREWYILGPMVNVPFNYKTC